MKDYKKASPRAMPLGPAMLAAVIRRDFGEEIRTRILNLFLDQPAVECADRILESNPDHVGFSMYVWNRSLALEIAEILKQRRPGRDIFAGEAEATADQVGILGDPAIDFVLAGEGEDLIVETLGRLLKGATPQEIAASARPIPVKDLAALPSPFLDGTLKLADYSGALEELQTIDQVMNFLQYRDNTLAQLLCNETFLPRASRFDPIPDMEWSFGNIGVNDKARFLATMYIE